jgi:hypothetical protein
MYGVETREKPTSSEDIRSRLPSTICFPPFLCLLFGASYTKPAANRIGSLGSAFLGLLRRCNAPSRGTPYYGPTAIMIATTFIGWFWTTAIRLWGGCNAERNGPAMLRRLMLHGFKQCCL